MPLTGVYSCISSKAVHVCSIHCINITVIYTEYMENVRIFGWVVDSCNSSKAVHVCSIYCMYIIILYISYILYICKHTWRCEDIRVGCRCVSIMASYYDHLVTEVEH